MDDGLILRGGRPDEAALLSDLAVRSKAHWGYDESFIDACREELTLSPHDVGRLTVVVGELDGGVAGFYGLEPLDREKVELAYLFVDPPWIGTGVGRRLMDDAIVAARRRRFRALVIQADPFAEAFYAHIGAVRVGGSPSASIPGRVLPVLELDLAIGP